MGFKKNANGEWCSFKSQLKKAKSIVSGYEQVNDR